MASKGSKLLTDEIQEIVSPNSNAEESLHPSRNPKASKSWRSGGWRLTVLLGFVAAVCVFVINLGVLIWGAVAGQATSDGITIVYRGNCDKARNIGTFGHLAINVLGSLLLAASNNAMQLVLAPTRAEIDAAHTRRRWLDVGVHSIRNFASTSTGRRALWVLLVLSSLPLHLLYNSVLVGSQTENDYLVAVVSSEFVTGGQFNDTRASNCFSNEFNYLLPTDMGPVLSYFQNNQAQLTRLDNEDCIQAYSQSPLTAWGSVILVTTATSNDSVLNIIESDGFTSAGDWLYSEASTLDPSNWRMPGTSVADIPVHGMPYVNPFGGLNGACEPDLSQTFTVDHCLAQPATDNCSLGLSVPLLAVVLVCNAIKAACFYWIFRRLHFQPLTTAGDAIASFLEHPDAVTAGYGAIEATNENWTKQWAPSRVPWQALRRSGFAAASAARWIWSSILFVGFWAICAGLLGLGMQQYDTVTSFSGIAATGLGRIVQKKLVGEIHAGLLACVLLANLPQLIVSVLYVLYNDLMTRMLLAKEWAAYAGSHKPLRVREPRGHQRKTHFLSLPWKFSAPFLVLMMVLHWFISQSIFLAYVVGSNYAQLDSSGAPTSEGIVTLGVGWSPLGLLLALILGGALIVFLWLMAAVLRYPAGIPLVRSSSAAMSAACHPAPWDTDAAAQLVGYGVIQGQKGENGLACVGFSSEPVSPLVQGQVYA